jgi:hypothetical protein
VPFSAKRPALTQPRPLVRFRSQRLEKGTGCPPKCTGGLAKGDAGHSPVNYLDKLFTNPISITIHVGYGEVDGFQLGSNALGESYYAVSEPETYSAVVSALKAENAPGASTLPANSPFPAV